VTEFPNGTAISPDNSTLIISESFAGRLSAFDIADDGGLSGRRVWADGIGPDGICLDAEGAVWTRSARTRTHTGDERDPAGLFVRVAEVIAERTGQVLVADVPVAGAGWP
jgi:sugar lactone lactonase YvrE